MIPERVQQMLDALRQVYGEEGCDASQYRNSEWRICIRGRSFSGRDGVPQDKPASVVTLTFNGDHWTADYSMPLRGVLLQQFTPKEYLTICE